MIHCGSFKTLAEAQMAAQAFRDREKSMKKPQEKLVRIRLSVARAKLVAQEIGAWLDVNDRNIYPFSRKEYLALRSAHRQLLTQIKMIQSEELKNG